MPRASYVIKAEVRDPGAPAWRFPRQKTMYGGKRIAVGDVVYVFASENEGGDGLVARGIVTAARAVPRVPGVARQTPRVDVEVRRVAAVARRLGRRELKPCTTWGDGRPDTELNFKLYRQATDKIVGVSPAAAVFLAGHFDPSGPVAELGRVRAEVRRGGGERTGAARRRSRGSGPA